MARFSLLWTERQKKVIEEEAQMRGISVSDMLRRILDEYVDRKLDRKDDEFYGGD